MFKFSKKLAAATVVTSLICSSSFATLVRSTEDVSTGTPTQLAQKFAYEKNVNITYNIFDTLLGTIAGSTEFAVGPVSIGVTGAYMFNDYSSDNSGNGTQAANSKYYSAGAFVTFAFNRQVMSTGWLIQPTLEYWNLKFNNNSAGGQQLTGQGVSLEAPFIYQWMWSSGFNMRMGLGPSYRWLTGTATNGGLGNFYSATRRGLGVTGLFTIGYAL